MKRRQFIANAAMIGASMQPFVRAWSKPSSCGERKLASPKQPVFIYNNLSAYGNRELLNNEDAPWFAEGQMMYHELQKEDSTITFGSIPGNGEPYGFKPSSTKGTLCTVVNPSQPIATISLPVGNKPGSNIIYADRGFRPRVKGNILTLGPEQLAVVGYDEYADYFEKRAELFYNLGEDNTINIPLTQLAISVFAETQYFASRTQIEVKKGRIHFA